MLLSLNPKRNLRLQVNAFPFQGPAQKTICCVDCSLRMQGYSSARVNECAGGGGLDLLPNEHSFLGVGEKDC